MNDYEYAKLYDELTESEETRRKRTEQYEMAR